MKYSEHFGDKGFHTTVMTTFGIDFDAYETVVLPRLQGSGCHNNIVLSDAGMLTYALDGGSALPAAAGRQYSVVGAQVGGRGVFHPKIVLQVGRQQARLFVGSANISASGLGGNLEVVGRLNCNRGDSGERRIIAAAWHYLERHLDREQSAVSHQIEWMRTRAGWLLDTPPAEGPVTLTDGTLAAFQSDGGAASIGSRFADLVGGEPVDRLVVISPYWDEELTALSHLAARLNPREVVIFIDTTSTFFPGMALSVLPNARILDLRQFAQQRFVHAKAIVAQTQDWDHLLYGSANCTLAALGTSDWQGWNAEACLYRRLAPGAAIDTLRLTELVEHAPALDPHALPAYVRAELLPLAETHLRCPGRFECQRDVLYWRPSGSRDGQVELLDTMGDRLAANLVPVGASRDLLTFKLSGLSARPAFARLRIADGTVSAPAVVSAVDVLREAVREPRSRQIELAAQQLGEETEEGLWLLEMLDDLEAAEIQLLRVDKLPAPGGAQRDGAAGTGQAAYQTLSYDKFVEGRRLRGENIRPTQHSFLGSELSLVRGFLNRILAIDRGRAPHDEACNDAALANAFDLGDETEDAASAVESGKEFPGGERREASGVPPEGQHGMRVQQMRATRQQIAACVEKFQNAMRKRAETGDLSAADLLRLRVLLMVVAASGCGLYEVALDMPQHQIQRSSFQVLPMDGEYAWPLMLGRVLFAFFGGNPAPIRALKIDIGHSDIPDDMLECWATCYWATQACLLAATTYAGAAVVNRNGRLGRLAATIYNLTGLRPDELQSDGIRQLFDALSARFESRLVMSPAGLTELYERHLAACGYEEK